MRRLALLALFCLPAWAAPVSDLQQKLADIDGFSAVFEQLARDAGGRQIQSVPGQLSLARPNLLRWQTDDPIPSIGVSDGTDLWTYDLDLEQVTVEPASVLEDSPAGLLLSLNPEGLTQRFDVSFTQGLEGQQLYQLTPKRDEIYQLVVLEFLNNQPLSVGVVDSLGQQTRIRFSEVEMGVSVLSDEFQFTLPDGVDLLDLRQ